jgi:hypothetical protein
MFHARRLRRFIPRNGTTLAALQEAVSGPKDDGEEESKGEWQELQEELDQELELIEELEEDE